jgi:hypothetical protein
VEWCESLFHSTLVVPCFFLDLGAPHPVFIGHHFEGFGAGQGSRPPAVVLPCAVSHSGLLSCCFTSVLLYFCILYAFYQPPVFQSALLKLDHDQ